MTGDEAASLREQLRTFTTNSTTLATKTLTYDGQQFEVRQLSLRDRKRLQEKAEKEKADLNVLVAIHSTYVPGTDLKLFEPADAIMLLNQPSGGLTDCLASTMGELILEAQARGKPLASELKT